MLRENHPMSATPGRSTPVCCVANSNTLMNISGNRRVYYVIGCGGHTNSKLGIFESSAGIECYLTTDHWR